MDISSMLRYLILVCALIIYAKLWGQNIYHKGGDDIFYLNTLDESDRRNTLKRGSYVGPHVLGDSITRLMNEFESEFVFYRNTGGAYPVEEKMVIKRPIYKGVHDFEKYLRELLKNKSVNEADAAVRLTRILKVSIKLVDYNTQELEKILKKTKDPLFFEQCILKIRFR